MSIAQPKTDATAPPVGTYRAAVVHDFHSPLVIEQVLPPELEPNQVRVKVEASGLCHTDIHAAHGDWPVKPSPPFIPGHEGVGRVVERGSAVTEVEIGDRVGMPWLGYACGTCDYCVSGWETLCLDQKNMGYSIDGGFGEYAAAYGHYIVKIPDGVDPFDAAPLTCAGVTTYKAIKMAGTRSSEWRCSESAVSATWRSSTRRSRAGEWSPSISSTRSWSWLVTSVPSSLSTPRARIRWRRFRGLAAPIRRLPCCRLRTPRRSCRHGSCWTSRCGARS